MYWKHCNFKENIIAIYYFSSITIVFLKTNRPLESYELLFIMYKCAMNFHNISVTIIIIEYQLGREPFPYVLLFCLLAFKAYFMQPEIFSEMCLSNILL